MHCLYGQGGVRGPYSVQTIMQGNGLDAGSAVAFLPILLDSIEGLARSLFRTVVSWGTDKHFPASLASWFYLFFFR